MLLASLSTDPASCPQYEEHMKAAAATSAETAAQTDPMGSCPMHAQHKANASPHHTESVDARHDTLGMSHEKAHHSFRLFADGGAIELQAVDAGDAATIAAIRTHLHAIAEAFAKADFSTPAFVHGNAPPGVATMKSLKTGIAYRYEELPAGARVHIITTASDALPAIHDFLRFQVTEHRTGNSGQVELDR
jgi:hypothetical protein